MISYLYIENYREDNHIIPMDIDAEPTSSQPNIGLNNADVYIVADKYDIQPLEALAATKITNWAQINAKSLGFFRHGTSYSALRVKFSGNDEVTNLMREYGVFGLTVLELVNKSHVFSSDELKDSHAREKFYLQVHFNGFKEQIDTLNERVTNLQRENAHLRILLA
ncbi:uncharacterized protein N7473_003610 [Penicillium subrubescens]|uniref:uncharacterized protein n=1 Tax=Penicillium subrubescens TaxID=1316194 RepID=UPI002544E900|nr:uncharacterized protein N7473_003610 [Penicillium subrubescens]KAJ5906694.1 hypothetical protein N7473_003610 [Penicillium subrubescens]